MSLIFQNTSRGGGGGRRSQGGVGGLLVSPATGRDEGDSVETPGLLLLKGGTDDVTTRGSDSCAGYVVEL